MKLLYGVGNVDGILTKVSGKPTKLYTLWSNMLARCYSEKYQQRQPTYIGCEVSENFKSFKFFSEWCLGQKGYGLQNYALDKDLLKKGNKMYSEDLCVFLPRQLNSVLCKRDKLRGDLPIGVSRNKISISSPYSCYMGKYGKTHLLGVSDDPYVLFNIYKQEKEKYIKELAYKYKDNIDIRVFNALLKYEVNIND